MRYEEAAEWADFDVAPAGDRIDVRRAPATSLDELVEMLVTQVLSVTMAQRGATCLHAATLRIGSAIVLLCGPSGTGKSTTAAALAKRGCDLLGDDVAALDADAAPPTVLAGASRVRLRPDAARVLAGDRPLVSVWGEHRGSEHKRYAAYPAAVGADGPVVVDAVYVLAARDAAARAPAVAPLPAAEGLPALMACRHAAAVRSDEGHRRDFAALARLAQAVPLRLVRRPDGLDALGAIADALVADARAFG